MAIKKKAMKLISLYLGDKEDGYVKKLQSRYNLSKAATIRMALLKWAELEGMVR